MREGKWWKLSLGIRFSLESPTCETFSKSNKLKNNKLRCIMKKLLVALLLLLPLAIETQASGGGGGGGGGGSFSGGGGSFSGGGGPRVRKVNTKLFDRGKDIFGGNFTPVRNVSRSTANSQARNLVQMKKKLAKDFEREAEKFDIRKLAGRVSANDMRALKYYLDVRFLKKERYRR